MDLPGTSEVKHFSELAPAACFSLRLIELQHQFGSFLHALSQVICARLIAPEALPHWKHQRALS